MPSTKPSTPRKYLNRRTSAAASLILLQAVTPIGPSTATPGCNLDTQPNCQASERSPRPSPRNPQGASGGNTGCPQISHGIPGQGCHDGADVRKQARSIDLARQARDTLTLPAVHIRWWSGPGLGVEIDQNALNQVNESIRQNGQTVTIRAAPACVYWNLGTDKIHYALHNQSDAAACRRRNPQPPPERTGDQHITATIKWHITWNCTGSCHPVQAHGKLDDLYTSSTAPPLD